VTASQRLKKLEELKQESAEALSNCDPFLSWQAQVGAVLSFDPGLREAFLNICEGIVREGLFPYRRGVGKALKLGNALETVLTELRVLTAAELNRLPSMEERKMPESNSAAKPDAISKSPKVIGEALGAEQGILWFWHHCNYKVKWMVIFWAASASISIFSVGVAAGRNDFFGKLYDLFKETSATAPATKTSK
jgi:hypothetical protein